MKRMLGWYETMQHKAMNDVFGKGPRDDAGGKKRGVGTGSERRNKYLSKCGALVSLFFQRR